MPKKFMSYTQYIELWNNRERLQDLGVNTDRKTNKKGKKGVKRGKWDYIKWQLMAFTEFKKFFIYYV